MFQDITERERAKRGLHESSTMLQLVLDTIPQYICWKDRNSRFLGCNQNYAEMVGLPNPQAIVGKTDWDLPWKKEETESFLKMDQKVMAQNQPQYHIIEPALNAQGKPTWLDTSKAPLLDAAGNVTGILVAFEDVTARKKADETLRRLNRELRAISDCNQALVRATDEQSLLNDVCRTICQVAGYLSAWVGFAEDDAEKSVRPVAWAGVVIEQASSLKTTWADNGEGNGPTGNSIRAAKSCISQDLCGELGGKSGRLHPEHRAAIALPLLDGKGRAFGALTIYSAQTNAFTDEEIRLLEELAGDLAFGIIGLRNRDEHRRAEAERQRLQIQLLQAQKLEAIGQLAGGVAHDFNNILASMMMRLCMLQQDSIAAEEVKTSVDELIEETNRASSLTRQLLLFSRRSVIGTKVFDPKELVLGLLKMLRRLIGEHITLEFKHASAIPLVEADPGMIEQVVMNLVVNSRDAMPHGGTVTIALNAMDVDKSRRKANPEHVGPFICLSVTDTGCGMDRATLERVFDPFYTTKDPGKGTGLGLSIVQSAAAQHNGWVEVESAPGKGSIFQFYIPATSKSLPLAHLKAAPVSRGAGETILVVEDEDHLRGPVVKNLKNLGYNILEASNGREAQRLWNEHKSHVDLLFTDMVMPGGMTGLELCVSLRTEQPALRVVITSGYIPEYADREKLSGQNVTYLQKPFDLDSLSQIIQASLHQP